MNARTPYWPLFRNELGFDYYPKIPWALGCGFCLALWVASSVAPLSLLVKVSNGDLVTFFAAFGDLIGMALVWLLMMTGWLFAFALLPGISNPVQGVRAFEFMFTRAIDRRQIFRTRAAVIYLMMLGPLLLNVVVSANLPRSADDPLIFNTPVYSPSYLAGANRQREEKVRTLRNPKAEKLPVPGELMLVPNEVALTAWVFWLGALSLLFMQGHCVLLAPRVQHNPWLAGLAIGTPVLAACFLAQWIPRHYPRFYEESFLFFARNSVALLILLVALGAVVQVFSERRFSKLEIL